MNVHTDYKLENVLPNPFQTRGQEDPEHVQQLMESIRASGLLQWPVARQSLADPKKVELAFGHSRLAAYKKLYEEEQPKYKDADTNPYAKLPLEIRELNDQQMFELAVRENRDRKDLTPIEEARAMVLYRNKFGKTSAEIGELFQLSDSAVRNRMRLLQLPANVQAEIGKSIAEGTARILLTIMRIVKPKVLVAFMEMITKMAGTEDWGSAETLMEIRSMINSSETTELVSHYTSSGPDPKVLGCYWKLSWELGNLAKNLPVIKIKTFNTLFSKEFPEHVAMEDEEFFGQMLFKAQAGLSTEEIAMMPGEVNELRADVLRSLVNPPPCAACPFRVALGGDHWCGFKPCFNQKKKLWIQEEVERVSVETGVKVYVPADGKWDDLMTWRDEDRQLWTARGEDLRVRGLNASPYGGKGYTGTSCVEAVAVGKEYEKRHTIEEGVKDSFGDDHYQSRNKQFHENEAKKAAFNDQMVIPVLAQALLSGITCLPFLEHVEGDQWMEEQQVPQDKAGRLQFFQRCLMASMLDRLSIDSAGWGEQTVVDYAKELMHLATAWGIQKQLPENFMELAEQIHVGGEDDEDTEDDQEENDTDEAGAEEHEPS